MAATTEHTRYYQVITPQVYREIRVRDDRKWTPAETRQMRQLERLAEQHRTSVESTTYRRG